MVPLVLVIVEALLINHLRIHGGRQVEESNIIKETLDTFNDIG